MKAANPLGPVIRQTTLTQTISPASRHTRSLEYATFPCLQIIFRLLYSTVYNYLFISTNLRSKKEVKRTVRGEPFVEIESGW